MISIDNNTITMTRGSSLSLTVTAFNADGSNYEPQEGDVFSFALKHSKIVDGNFVDEDPLIYKEIPTESMLLELNPADTKPLPFGVYFYDIRVVMADGYTDPFITGTLILTPEAH